MCGLHDRGVYFRGINFSNVLLCPDGEFGLIDVGSVSFKNKPLDPELRARNLKHPLAYRADRDSLIEYGLDRFIRTYIGETKFGSKQQDQFLRKLHKQHSLFRDIPD